MTAEIPKKARRRERIAGTAKRLAIREYAPFGGWILSWFFIGLALGHADAVRLLAVNGFVQSIRQICTVEAMQVLGRRTGLDKAIYKAARKVAVRIESIFLLVWLAATAGLVALLNYRGFAEPAGMLAIASLGIAARNPLALLVAKRDRGISWRLGSAPPDSRPSPSPTSGLVFLFGLPWWAAAIALAARDWGGLVATILFAPVRSPSETSREEMTFAETARRTEMSARQQLSYRLISSVATLTMGPFGKFVARTSREVGRLDSRLARLVPRKKSGFLLFVAITLGAAISSLFVAREPSTLLASAAFTRLAASGVVVLLWWRFAGDPAEDDFMDDE